MQKRGESFDGTKINYDISRSRGSNNFLIFLHGFSSNLTAWRNERAFFHKLGIPTLAVDLRGHGKSDRPNSLEDYKVEKFAKDIRAILKKEKISKIVLIGHSFGGMIAITFHKLYPNVSKGYVLVSTSCKTPRGVKAFFKKFSSTIYFLNGILTKIRLYGTKFTHTNYKFFRKTKDRNIIRIIWNMLKTSLKSWLFTFENIADFDEVGVLKTIKKPVLIIEGAEDSILDIYNSRKLHELIRSSELKLIPKADHIILSTHSSEIEEEIYDFIKNIKGFIKIRKKRQ